MNKSHPFFHSPKSWSRRKHRLLAKYLKPFGAKVGSWASEIYCVDGFAGVGKYDDNSPGSPLLMAQLADECASWRKPVALRLINVESDPSVLASLNELTSKWVSQNIVENMHGEFGKLVPEIVRKIGNSPAFFFIDPFGPTEIHFSYLLTILERAQSATELIINFDVDGVRRIGDTMHPKSQTPFTSKIAQTNIERVTKIIGSDGWRAKFAEGTFSTKDRELLLLQEYTANLEKYGYHVVAYPIRKSIGDSPKYYLIFCTRHRDGISLMNDFIREEEDELLREATTKPSQPALLDEVLEEEKRRRVELKGLVEQYVQQNIETTRGQIKLHFKFKHFGEFHEKDFNAVVKEFVDTGSLKTSHGRKQINDGTLLQYTP